VSAGAPSTDECDRDIAVAVLISDRALHGRVTDALSATRGLVLVDEEEAEVTVSDTLPVDDRPAVVLGAGENARFGPTTLPAGSSATVLRIAIEAALHGFICLSRNADQAGTLADDSEKIYSVASQAILTARELEVLQLMSEGASNKIIARHLDISVHTAKFHVGSILEKLGAGSRADAVARGIRLGFVLL